jgi:hypothetical protein
MKWIGLLGLILLYGLSAEASSEMIIPCRIQVQPVFFVPQGEADSTKEQQFKLQKYIKLTQLCYRKMLNGKETFELSKKDILIYQSQHPLEYYKKEDQKSLSLLPVRELFEAYGYNRFTCPYVYVIVFMNSKEDFPAGGGRPFNRGFNNGGGLVYLSSYGLEHNSHFQSTLLHELGHGFGLVHIDAYGYDMNTNFSIMSYNFDNWWDGFKVKKRAGILIPEDLRALNYNKRVFPDFHFDPATDIPKGYKISNLVVLLAPPDDIPEEKPFAIITQSNCPELLGSKTQNVVHKQILTFDFPKTEKGIKGFDADSMWMTKVTAAQWGTLDIHFPIGVVLTKICLHAGCGENLYAIKKIKLQTIQGEKVSDLAETSISAPNTFVSFEACSTDHLRLSFQASDEGTVILRGIRFFSKDCEIFCPDYPIFD